MIGNQIWARHSPEDGLLHTNASQIKTNTFEQILAKIDGCILYKNIYFNTYSTTVITIGKIFAIASIPQFQKKGAVPKRALTVGTPRISCALFTSGKFLKYNYIISQ